MISRSVFLIAPIAITAGLAGWASFPAGAPRELLQPPRELASQNSAAVLERGAEFLWSQQAADGAWRSETYGLLKTGQVLTPFVLHSLLQVPESVCPRPTGGVARALNFIRRSADPRGALGTADADVLEYPNYATALALRCLLSAGRDEDRDLIVRLRTYLERQQFTEARGFEPAMLAYGGWGFGGEHPRGQTGHIDLSHVRYVLEALREAGASNVVFRRSESFLRVVQKDPLETRPQPSLVPEHPRRSNAEIYDGGFYISPIILAANKGQPPENTDPGHWYSYATATCDGVLSLLAAGVPLEDRRIQDARAWLEKHLRIDYPEGIPPVSDQYPLPWGDAIRFYHYAVRAQTYAALDWPGNWQQPLGQQLEQIQREDGSFVNDASPLMKEDDPLVATTLAILALSAWQNN